MTYLVGIILLLVFLAFAALMFLERLSALLALPLMALAFLLVAAGADLFQPATVTELVTRETVDEFGRRHVAAAPAEVPSRFEQWLDVRLTQHVLLKTKAMLLERVAGELEHTLDQAPQSPQLLRAAVADARRSLAAFEQRVERELATRPQFFARPPHYGGQAADFRAELAAIGIGEHLQVIANVLDREPLAVARERIRATLAEMKDSAGRHRAAGDTLPQHDGTGFRVRSGLLYLRYYGIAVLRAGGLKLYAAIIATIFGGMFAMYVKNLNVAERLVLWTAEFAGERPVVVALAVFLVTGVIFTSVGGLGTVIMLGTIILPILRSIGLGPVAAAGVFLIGLSMGGTLDPVSRRLWMELFGIPGGTLNSMLWTMVGLYAAVGVAWIAWGGRQSLRSSLHAEPVAEPAPAARPVPARLMIAPLIPVGLVYFAGVDEIAAFTVALVYMYVCVCRRPGATRIFARSLIEGAQVVMPPVLLMVGIGMLLVSLSTAPVQSYLQPLLAAAVPGSQLGYIVTFGLAAPLALYRGPLNRWGMGLAVATILLATGQLSPPAILGVILAAGMLQGVSDPTNTANVWIAGFQGITVNQILRYTILPVWAAAIVAVMLFGLRFVGG